MKFPFFKHLWHNIGYAVGALIVLCIVACLGAAVIIAALKFISWLALL
jgi:hypothetical protein